MIDRYVHDLNVHGWNIRKLVMWWDSNIGVNDPTSRTARTGREEVTGFAPSFIYCHKLLKFDRNGMCIQMWISTAIVYLPNFEMRSPHADCKGKFRKTHLGAKNKLRFSVSQESTAAISTASLQNIILQMSVVRLWCPQYTEYQGLITRALNIGFQWTISVVKECWPTIRHTY